MIRTFALSSIIFASLGVGAQAADDVTVSQEGKAFSAREVTVKAGDRVTFTNNDSVTHNVYSRSRGNKFDSGAQAPGTSMSQVFPSAGKVKVRCAIHPRMKLTVNVEE